MAGSGRPGYPREVRRQFWIELQSGCSVSAAARAVGVPPSTAANWVGEAGGVSPSLHAPALSRLSFLDREEIWFARARGESMRSIAGRLGRAPSTISRELRLRSGRAGYRPSVAESEARRLAARPRGGKLAGNDRLREYVQTGLSAKHSPEQISLRLRRDFPDEPEMRVSHETIYQALYIEGRGELKRELVAALRTGRALRRTQGRTRGSRMRDMVMIADRPGEVDDRAIPGHWEGDLIVGKDSASAIGTLVERSTGFVMLLHLPERHGAIEVRDQMITAIGRMPAALRKTVTWDQGVEMAKHREITIATGVDIYFCDPHSPWQRGSNENTNGLLRQYFPKGTDLSGYHPDYLDYVAAQLNDRPRKRLDAATPREALNELLSDQQNGSVATTT